MSQTTTRKLHNCRTRMYSTPSHVTLKGETQPGGQKHASGKYPCKLSVEKNLLDTLQAANYVDLAITTELAGILTLTYSKMFTTTEISFLQTYNFKTKHSIRQCDDQTESGPSFFPVKNTSALQR